MFIAPIVGDRKISIVSDKNLYKKMVMVTLDFWKDFGEKVPLSLTYPGIVKGKEYIITVVNLTKGTPVHNIPAEYKGYPLLVNYGTMKPSSNIYHQFQHLKPRISIGDSENNSTCTLGVLFEVKNRNEKKYILTVKHGVGGEGSSVIQPGKVDNVCSYRNRNCEPY